VNALTQGVRLTGEGFLRARFFLLQARCLAQFLAPGALFGQRRLIFLEAGLDGGRPFQELLVGATALCVGELLSL